MSSYTLEPIGFIRSTVKGREDASRQGPEGAPDAWLEIEPRFAEGLLGMEVGHELIVITWLHEAKRDVLTGHPRNDPNRPLTGAFYTRSPARPNPRGLHPVTVRAIEGMRLKIGPIEAFDGTQWSILNPHRPVPTDDEFEVYVSLGLISPVSKRFSSSLKWSSSAHRRR
jgi:tRNA-Thr(GGU) m(6)t(6)A37 methyltransferase TsaA